MDDQVQHEDANNLEVAGNQELGVDQEPTENQEVEENQNPLLIGAAHNGINQANPLANNGNVHSTTGNQVPPMFPQPIIPPMIPQPPGTPATDMGAFMLMMQQQMYQQQQQMTLKLTIHLCVGVLVTVSFGSIVFGKNKQTLLYEDFTK